MSEAQSSNNSQSKIWTPANIVTVTRILLVPLFVVALLCPWGVWLGSSFITYWQPWIAAAIFIVLSATDAVDGHLARSRDEVTNFGKFIDPLADKILVAAALLCLVEMQTLPSWIALIIIVREFIISGLRMLAATEGVVIAASWCGKAKTATTMVALVLFLLKDSAVVLAQSAGFVSVFHVLSWICMIAAVILTVVSLVDYFIKSLPVLGFGSTARVSDAAKQASTQTCTNGRLAYEGQDSKSTGTVDNSKEVCSSVSDQTKVSTLYASSDADIAARAAEVIAAARAHNLTISTAESCTGGLIAGALTAIAGSSDVVQGGVVSYSNSVKHNVLDVSTHDLATVGAVSSEVAQQMAVGSKHQLSANIAVSVTGVAGPGGGSADKPVGTVWFGVCSDKGCYSEVCHFSGSRSEVRAATVVHALALIQYEITKY